MGIQIEPMITVRDVRASSEFYQKVLAAQSGHGGDEYEQIVRDGVLLLQLHHQDAHEHPYLYDGDVTVGNGVLLWFCSDSFDEDVARIRGAGVEMLEEPHVNELASHRECLFLDPDGYRVVFSSPFGDVG